MKIIHTADLHLGQIIYQNYDRVDEHEHFFKQLRSICGEEKPDALVVSGDVFDIPQPSAATRKFFTENFVHLHDIRPEMKIVITAGNHDSAARLQADSAVWELANAKIVGSAPSSDLLGTEDGWQDDYIVKLDSGYIVALPFMNGEHTKVIQSILDRVAEDNTDGKPVVMTGHLAVTGTDVTGHDFEIGKIKTQSVETLGKGYDYLALGHIHKPQTIGHQEDCMKDDVTYPSGVARYSGSALHVSCDEKYPHSVSIVEIGSRGGDVRIRQARIEQLRHFWELPLDGGSFNSAKEAKAAVKDLIKEYGRGYFRLRFDYRASIEANFNNEIYDILALGDDDMRFNPKHIWTGVPVRTAEESAKPTFEVAEIQQMTDPMAFIEKTAGQYPGFDLDELREAFEEVKAEVKRFDEENAAKSKNKASKKNAAGEPSNINE